VYEIGKHYYYFMLCYALVFMVCFAKTGIRKRGKNEKEDNTFFMHSCTNLQTSEQTSGYWLLSDYGVSALFRC